ncbi:MAG TPA: tetratricopeptide repeat protein [Bacillota bacterium]|nr:tetratricopeptide repeat protein [Bacillota bacterium]
MGFFSRVNSLLNRQINLAYRLRLGTAALIALVFITFSSGTAYYLTHFGGERQGSFTRQVNDLEAAGARQSMDRHTVELALAYYLNEDSSEAEQILKGVLKQEPSNGLANIYYGLIQADRGKYRTAIPYLEQGIRIAPREEPLAYGYLGQAYFRTGQAQKAIRFLQLACQAEPESPSNYYYLGLVYSSRSEVAKARSSLEKALLLSGNNYPEAWKALQQTKDIK